MVATNGRMKEKTHGGIPNSVIGPAYHETMRETRNQPERWMAEESQIFKKFLCRFGGNMYDSVTDREAKYIAIAFRKEDQGKGYQLWCAQNGVEEIRGNGSRKRSKKKLPIKTIKKRTISPELRAYYDSEFFRMIKTESLRKYPVCRICKTRASETVHHGVYDYINTLEDLNHVIAVCSDCHLVAEMACEYQREQKRLNELVLNEVNGQ